MLSLVALLDPPLILPELRNREAAFARLLDETTSDQAAADLAYAAHATWFTLDPANVTWVTPPAARISAVFGAIGRA
jgi:hypothetical protein